MPIFTVTAVEFDFTDSEGELPLDQQEEVINNTLLSPWYVDEEESLADEISDSTGWCIKNIEYHECGT